MKCKTAPEALAKIGIKTATVSAMDSRTAIQIPGSVMPNAYAEVKVTPIAAGIVTKMWSWGPRSGFRSAIDDKRDEEAVMDAAGSCRCSPKGGTGWSFA